MKLSFACFLATTVSILTLLAIFVLSAFIYDSVRAPDQVTHPETALRGTASKRSLDGAFAKADLPPQQTPATIDLIRPEKSNETKIESPAKPANPSIRPAAFVESTNNQGAERLVSSSTALSTKPRIDTPPNVAKEIKVAPKAFQANVANLEPSATGASIDRETVNVPESEALLPVSISDLGVSYATHEHESSEYFDLVAQLSHDDRQIPKVREHQARQDQEWLQTLSNTEAQIASVAVDHTFDDSASTERADSTTAHMTSDTLTVDDTIDYEMTPESFAVETSLPESIQTSPNPTTSSIQDRSFADAAAVDVIDHWLQPETEVTQEASATTVVDRQVSSFVQAIVQNNPVPDEKPTPVKPSDEIAGVELPQRSPEHQGGGQAVAANEQNSPAETMVESGETNDEPKVPVATAETKQAPGSRIVALNKKAPEIVGWPLPDSLIADLDHLGKFRMTADWAVATKHAVEQLNQLEITNPQSIPWISHCQKLANQLSEYATSLATSNPQYHDSAAYMTQVAYRIQRRAVIWAQVHKIAAQHFAEAPDTVGNAVAQQIALRSRQISFDSIDPLWSEYLMLDQAGEIFSNSNPNPVKYRAIAQKILARVTSTSLNADQAAYAQNLIGNDLGDVLRGVASGKLDLGQFLVDMERFESRASSVSKTRLSGHFQNYYWHRQKEIQDLADLIDDHYRNANLRIEFSQHLINRMIPREATTYHQPVTDRILGARVFGQSRITNRIQVQLVPDPNHLSFRLQSNGRILSNTRAHAQGFTFSNLGNGLVNASKIIAIGEEGVSAAATNVRASSQTRLIDVKGQMDHVPVFGGIARRLAEQQEQAKGFQAKQIVESKMRSEFRARIDEEIQAQVARGKQWFQTNVLNPLHAMELEPTVVQLQTTENAAVVRYRLASLDQIAADTPRPRSQSGSLASFQMHRSAVNNIVNRIHINGKTFTPQEFMDHLNMLLGRDDLAVPSGQNQDVTFEFATRDAVQLEFHEGKVTILLRIKKLQIGKRNRWKNLTVTARYSPVASGQNVALTFDEEFGLRVSGHRLKLADQLAVRTVFSSLFKPDFQFDILPPEMANHPAAQGLGISQLVLTDGWLGISLDRMPLHSRNSYQNSAGHRSHQQSNPSQVYQSQLYSSQQQNQRIQNTGRYSRPQSPKQPRQTLR